MVWCVNYKSIFFLRVISIFIFMEERNGVQPSWATHYKFVKFGRFNEHWIPKQKIQTWYDLKYELSDPVGIEPDRINIAVNNRLVFYQPGTLLEDIDIKKDDNCLVMVRKANQDESLAKKQREQMQKNMNDIKTKRNNLFYKKAYEEMKSSKERQNIYKRIVKQYSKWQCLIALKNCSTYDDVTTYLKTGKAKQYIEKMQIQKLDKIISQNIDYVRKQLEKDRSTQNYGNIVNLLGEQYPEFKKIQPNHQKYLQERLLGRELVPPRDIQLEKEIASTVEQSNKQRLRYQRSIKNVQRPPEHKSLQSIDELSKNAKINLILQFFSHPSFNEILPKLKGDKQKCKEFLLLIHQKHTNHKQLLALIQQNEQQIIKILSEGEPQVNEEEYYTFYQFAQGLTRSGFGKTEAIKFAKASQSSLQKLRIFLEAGGIIRNFKLAQQA